MKLLYRIIEHPLFSGSSILFIGSNLASFVNFLFHFILGRILKPGDYGELAAIVSLAGLLGIIPASLNLVAVKFISSSNNKKEISALIRWLRIKISNISIVLVAIIIILSPIISSFLKISEFGYLIILAIFFFFSLKSFLNRSILQGLLKFKEMVIASFTENSIKLFLSVVLVLLGFRVGGIMMAFVLSAIFGWIMTNLFLNNYNKINDSVVKPKHVIYFIFPVLINFISNTSMYTFDVILVKHFFSSHDAGIYAALSNLGKIIFFAVSPIGAVMFPLISRRYSKGQPFRLIFFCSFLMVLILSLSILILYWLFPQFIINLIYGPLYIEAAHLLVWFGMFMTLFSLSTLLVSFYLSLGDTKVMVLPAIASILQIIGILLFHERLIDVTIVSIVVTALLLVSLFIYFLHKIVSNEKVAIQDKFSFNYSSGI